MKQYPEITKEATEGIPTTLLQKMYTVMLRIRKFEEKVADLVSKKEIICPCHLCIGQEAVAAGVCAALDKNDFLYSTHRSHGHYIAKGGSLKRLMAELYGRASGCSKGKGGSMHIASPEIGLPGSSAIVAGTIPLAVGTALAFSLQEKKNVAVALFGDGAANEGVFYESLNFAGLKGLPVIFVCENNLYSTHMPISACLANTNIARKGEIFDIEGFRIDGNNAGEVFRTAKKAVEKAKGGKGPTLIECLTYRWRGHVGPNYDLAKGLRTKQELNYWMKRCPIKILGEFLTKESLLSEAEKNRINKETEKEVEEAVIFARESPFPGKSELLSDLFK